MKSQKRKGEQTMKIINTVTNQEVAYITTNHSMTLDEAIECAGEFVAADREDDPNVLIDGQLYYYDELDIRGDGWTADEE